MRQQSSINRICQDYPECDLFTGYDDYDSDIESDYDEELEIEDYHRV